MNEVVLTSSTFNDAKGVYGDFKNSVNSALRKIHQHEVNWPFTHVTKELVLTPNQTRYDYESNAKSVLFDTFRIPKSDITGNTTQHLCELDYEEFLERYSDMEYDPEQYARLPVRIFRTPKLQFGVAPSPDKAYTLLYEYYQLEPRLVNHTDIPLIPEEFRYVINDGSMVYAYRFRGDLELSELSKADFIQGIKDMRLTYINRTEYMRSTVVRDYPRFPPSLRTN